MLDLEIDMEEHHGEAEAKVFEAAGGYAPTIGIIGAVLGLIQVMKNLANIDEVGHGIAVAFVATVYGVGSANLLFLPAASQDQGAHPARRSQRKELIVEAVSGIVEGSESETDSAEAGSVRARGPARRSRKEKTGARARQVPPVSAPVKA